MTTIKQQLDFIQDLRDSFDNSQRMQIAVRYSPAQTAELLKDIHENLIGVRNYQHGRDVALCDDCNKPIKGIVNGQTTLNNIEVVPVGGKVCSECLDARIEFKGINN